ncbi:hypothetical protein WEI85_12160 [Actinomycetes bacterium KLBMP 9797]
MALFVVVALVGGQLSSFSWPANLLVFAVGGAFLAFALIRPVPRGPTRPLGRRGAWWLLPGGLFAVLEGTTFVAGSADYPTLSLLLDPVLEHAAARSLAWFGWLCGFWWLVRR